MEDENGMLSMFQTVHKAALRIEDLITDFDPNFDPNPNPRMRSGATVKP